MTDENKMESLPDSIWDMLEGFHASHPEYRYALVIDIRFGSFEIYYCKTLKRAEELSEGSFRFAIADLEN